MEDVMRQQQDLVGRFLDLSAGRRWLLTQVGSILAASAKHAHTLSAWRVAYYFKFRPHVIYKQFDQTLLDFSDTFHPSSFQSLRHPEEHPVFPP